MQSLALRFGEDGNQPLAARLRPTTLAEYVGQTHLLGPGKPLRKAIEQGQLHSMILWGPPGTGKTTLAELLAHHGGAQVLRLSAVTSGLKDIRQAVEQAQANQQQGHKTLLFVDEVHRFNKAQQDAFLPHIENGTLVFVGATTENPGFEVNHALLSRARVYRLQLLDPTELNQLFERALHDAELGLGALQLKFSADARTWLIRQAGGDGRRLLTNLEVISDFVDESTPVIEIDAIKTALGEAPSAFDKQGDHYYNVLSALHKSVRGSSVDGALYWYARFLVGGGDALVIARRLLAIASEDIGNADPRALQLALNAWDTYTRVGPAEGERALAQALVYCAAAPKSNAVYLAFKQARQAAEASAQASVPLHLRNAPTAQHKAQGAGEDYRYAHNFPHAYVAGERYLPTGVEGDYYQPQGRGLEQKLQAKLAWLNDLDQQSEWHRDDD